MNLSCFTEENGTLVFRDNGETMIVAPWGKDSVRVLSSYIGEPDFGCQALLPPGPSDSHISISEEQVVLENGNIRAVFRGGTWGVIYLTFENQEGKVLLSEMSAGGALSRKARDFEPLPGGGYRLHASFTADPEEKLYGMGQYQQEVLNLKGCSLELAQRNSQVSVPFCLSSAGYGFLWHNPAIGAVHFSTNVTVWEAEACSQLDYWITAGDTPAAILENYMRATGLPPMMPDWGMGFWQCKLRYYSQEDVLKTAREYHRLGVPVDVIVIDYYHWKRCGDWDFDPEYFPDPKAMADELAQMGIRCMVSIWPCVDWRSQNHAEMKQQGLLVKSDAGVDVQISFHGNNNYFDATNPRAREYVWNKVRKNYYDRGIRTYWLDEAEPEYHGYAFKRFHYAAGPVAAVGNRYPVDYARLFYDGMRESGETEIVSLIRCAWAGSARYGALVWSGDIMSTYEDFRKQLCCGIHMGLAGIPWWTTDIGGFHAGVAADPDFQELLLRWFAFGTFCPVMRIHGCRQPQTQIVNKEGEVREPTGAANEIWSYGEENYKIMRHYIEIREQMRPYTKAVMEETHEKGSPVIRALFYEFPEDPYAWEPKDEYLYGPDLLIAPVCRPGVTSREVYLPAGAQWTDARDGKVYAGGQTITAEAPIHTIPVYLRDGRQSWLTGLL